jgi:general secretion pathway protein H
MAHQVAKGMTQILARGRSDWRMKGFTLIELLVALVIVGIVVALVGINLVPDDARVLRTEAERLALLLEQARDEAVASGEPIAWSAEGTHYRFWRKDEEGKWVSWQQDELWRERSFAAGVALLELRINKQAVGLQERLVFAPGGMNAPFEIGLELGSAHASVSGDALGKIELKEAG